MIPFRIPQRFFNSSKPAIQQIQSFTKQFSNKTTTSTITLKDNCSQYTPELGFWQTSPYKSVSIVNQPLDKYIWSSLPKWQDRIAAVDVTTGRQYTYAQLRDCSATFALQLQNQFKLMKNDVLAVCLPNLPEFATVVLGGVEAGLIITTINPIYTAEEISRQLIISKPKIIVGTCADYKVLVEANKLAKIKIPIICVRMQNSDVLPQGAVDFFEMSTPRPNTSYGDIKQYDVHCDDLVILPFSSGTTGMPKGVMLSHNNLTTNCQQLITSFNYDTNSSQEVVPGILPFFHIYGFTVAMVSRLICGSKLVTMPEFKPVDFITSLQDYRASTVHLVPPMASLMVNNTKFTENTMGSLKRVVISASSFAKSDAQRFKQKFPNIEIYLGYGLTETSPGILLTAPNNTNYASMGFPISNTEVMVVPLDGGDLKGLSANQSGELCVRGPQVMKGYLNNDKATSEAFYPNGWLRTGDVGHYDDNGYFYITDRMKELIKVRGFQVAPAEIEALLKDHPKIRDAAVFGIPHTANREVPKALVVLQSSVSCSKEEICKYIAERVTHYKRLLGGVEFVDEIPKAPTGKILRRVIKEKYSN